MYESLICLGDIELKIELDEIIEKFKRNTSLNFIGTAVTIHQANGIDVALAKLRDEHKIVKGFVLLQSHPRTGRLLNEGNFYNLDESIVTYDFNFEFNHIEKPGLINGRIYALSSAVNNHNNRIIYVAVTIINYQWAYIIEKHIPNSKVVFVLLDDGDGSYANSYKDALQFEIYNNPNKSKLGLMLRLKLSYIYLSLYLYTLIKNKKVFYNRVFCIKKEQERILYIRNNTVAKYYDELYRKIGCAISSEILKLFEKTVLINTQCLKENNITDGIVDFELYKCLIDRLKKRKIRVLIKPHPREINIDKYRNLGCSVYSDFRFSQETIIAGTKIKPICIVSVFSSTLLNLKGVFGIPAVSLASILQSSELITKTFKDQLVDYISRYKSVIEFPSSMDEVEKLILELVVKG